jgi:succinyl-diaminopimelate desuccinylase
VEKIITREKGILGLRLVARGRSAHGARPWLGDNAIENLWSDYEKIKSFFPETDPDHWHRTLNFSRIHAGQSDNQVPDRAEAVFDIRFTEKDDPERLVAAMSDSVDGELTVISTAPVFDGGGSPYLDLLLDIAHGTVTGFEHGASDARHLSEKGIPAIVWGADGDLSQHASDEHVNIDSLARLYRLLDAFLYRAAEMPSAKNL